MKAKRRTKVMTKGKLAGSLADEFEINKSVARKIINSISNHAAKEGIRFTFPGLCRINIHVKPGKTKHAKTKPARTIVKVLPVAALKKSIPEQEEAAAEEEGSAAEEAAAEEGAAAAEEGGPAPAARRRRRRRWARGAFARPHIFQRV